MFSLSSFVFSRPMQRKDHDIKDLRAIFTRYGLTSPEYLSQYSLLLGHINVVWRFSMSVGSVQQLTIFWIAQKNLDDGLSHIRVNNNGSVYFFLSKNIMSLTFDLALIAICKAVSSALSAAVTRAFLSSKSWTISRLRFRTDFSNGVSPSFVAISKLGSAVRRDFTTCTWFFSTAQYKAVFLSWGFRLMTWMNQRYWMPITYLSSHIDVSIFLQKNIDDAFVSSFGSVYQIGISTSVLRSSHRY